MRRLDRYLIERVAGGWLIVILLLASVFSLQTFLEELDNIGRGHYHLLSALAFVALTLPERLVQLVPVTALLGTLVGLGTLASGGELVAMQATGVSARRVGWAVLKAGAVLVVIALALAQYVAPPLDQIAQTRRTLEISAASDLRTAHAFWSRDGTRFLNVRDIRHDRIPAGIDLYEFDAEGRLHTFIHAGRADVFNRHRWMLIGVVRKTFSGRGVTVEHIPRMPWRSFLRVQQMDLLILPIPSLSLTDLFEYVRYLKAHGQNADRYELALWNKLAIPLATTAMILVAIPFLFGPLRSVSTGLRITLGGTVGLAFYLISQISGYMGLLLGLNPAVTALAPATLLLVIGLWALRRVR
ncbi:lipopolysaccharide export system permease protein LptG [bacterium BMS3Bbin12]|nr:lipopolysaccharide export system permease protein LptG [bacterium BMS3Abin12]GBE48501.1 lipopolysaccharide export system permease protein LptG [bacterium BMS3Bbin12]GBE51488.1 lipopolysaccharide export system permease protein LptG [bacterium BMS3Bbin13]